MESHSIYEPPQVSHVLGSAGKKQGLASDLSTATFGGSGTLSAEAVMAHLPFVEEYVCIFWSGSHAIGWNHARSDLDIYVVSSAPVAVDREAPNVGDVWTFDVDAIPPTVTLVLGPFGPYRSDIEFWTEEQIDHILDRMPTGVELDNDMFTFSLTDREFLNKFVIGNALAGEEWLQERQSRVRSSGVGRAIAMKRMAYSHSLLEDTAGFLLDGSLDSAVLAIHEAFESAVDAVMALEGDLTPQAKWTARRLTTVNSDLIRFEEYWAVKTMKGFEQRSAREWVEVTAQRCHDLLVAVAVRLDGQGK